jgi:hypothetical protein
VGKLDANFSRRQWRNERFGPDFCSVDDAELDQTVECRIVAMSPEDEARQGPARRRTCPRAHALSRPDRRATARSRAQPSTKGFQGPLGSNLSRVVAGRDQSLSGTRAQNSVTLRYERRLRQPMETCIEQCEDCLTILVEIRNESNTSAKNVLRC